MSLTKRHLDKIDAHQRAVLERGKPTMKADCEIYPCGCVFNWSDKFWNYCELHNPAELEFYYQPTNFGMVY